ncbi:uncharacterized protein LOC143182604 [Calliopsis andreniformis]|uniref:uncharacterized protein LOC143182604 n=1 Tax=Calliopsis andreniformis TaxID=337506 RepID=UPI003FCECC58
MSIDSFDGLNTKLSDNIRRKDTVMRHVIPRLEMLAVTLRYLESGYNFVDLHYSYRIRHSTIGVIIRKVYRDIWLYMKTECFPVFSKKKCYKKLFCAILFGIVDSDYRFTYVDIRASGKEFDSYIFYKKKL